MKNPIKSAIELATPPVTDPASLSVPFKPGVPELDRLTTEHLADPYTAARLADELVQAGRFASLADAKEFAYLYLKQAKGQAVVPAAADYLAAEIARMCVAISLAADRAVANTKQSLLESAAGDVERAGQKLVLTRQKLQAIKEGLSGTVPLNDIAFESPNGLASIVEYFSREAGAERAAKWLETVEIPRQESHLGECRRKLDNLLEKATATHSPTVS